MSVLRAALYLQIPAEYCRSFGGLRWAQYGEAVEFLEGPAAGRTFAFAAEIARFLEGLHDAGALRPGLRVCVAPPLSDRSGRSRDAGGEYLWAVSRADRRAVPRAGMSAAQCRGTVRLALPRAAPGDADPPELAGIHEILTGGSWVPQMVLEPPELGSMDHAEQPGLGSEEFEALVRVAADALSDEAIRHWLRARPRPGWLGRRPAGPDSPTEPGGRAGRAGAHGRGSPAWDGWSAGLKAR